MTNYITYRCQHETVPENLSGPPRHGPHTLHEKLILFVCQLLVFNVTLLNVNLGLGLGSVLWLGSVLELFSCCLNIWNSLPDCVVDANSVNVFKKRLDKFWCNKAVRFDWKASLTGTGNRSEISLDNTLYCISEMDNWDPDIEELLCLRPRLPRCLVLSCFRLTLTHFLIIV